MTVSAPSQLPPLQESPAKGRRGRPRRFSMHRVVVACLGVGLAHAVDEAVLHRQPGVPVGQHLPALAVALVVAVAIMVRFPRWRAALQSAALVSTGTLTAVNGTLHLLHLGTGEVDAVDVTGAVAAVAGAVLFVLGLAIPWLRRGERPARTSVRWGRRAAAVVAAVVVVPMLLFPLCIGLVQVHMYRKPTGSPPTTAYRDVTFAAADGLQLSGWYRPSRNRAAVLLVPSAGGHRAGTVAHARLLASHGFGVLVYDARGAGRSEGSPNGWGWRWDRDVAGALDFLERQPDVDPSRIGALGLSTGADVLIEAAAEQPGRLAAVVGDGATARSYADSIHGPLEAPFVWTMIASGRLFSGTSPGDPLTELISRTDQTPFLLIAGGSLPQEREMNQRYAGAGRPSVTLWDLPDVDHTAGIRQVPEQYEQRVVGLFDRYLVEAG